MIWFIAEDCAYYQDLDSLQTQHNLDKLISLPSEADIATHLGGKVGFIAPFYPPKHIRSLFVIKSLPNKFGVLTTQEQHAGVPESKALETRLGLSVINSPFTLADVGGAQTLKDFTRELLIAESKGFRAKGVFLVGVPGTGKTFFPKCFAGETKRLLIQLNLTLIMEAQEPIDKLNSVFEYLTNRHEQHPDERFVLLIDEIEKMIGNAEAVEKRMLGRLLTVLNDMHTPAAEYKFDAIFFATANNLNSILDNNPELLRRGRFDELFFISLPSVEMAKGVFEIYLSKLKIKDELEQVMTLDNILTQIEQAYQKDNNDPDKFPYTSAEIETFCKKLAFYKLVYGEINIDHILNTIRLIIPIIKSAQEGINRMLAQKELFLLV